MKPYEPLSFFRLCHWNKGAYFNAFLASSTPFFLKAQKLLFESLTKGAKCYNQSQDPRKQEACNTIISPFPDHGESETLRISRSDQSSESFVSPQCNIAKNTESRNLDVCHHPPNAKINWIVIFWKKTRLSKKLKICELEGQQESPMSLSYEPSQLSIVEMMTNEPLSRHLRTKLELLVITSCTMLPLLYLVILKTEWK